MRSEGRDSQDSITVDGIAIRGATAADASDLAVLAGELGYPASAGDIERRLPGLLADRDHLLLVACESDRRMVGWIHAQLRRQLTNDAYVQVVGLVVAGDRRGANVGTRLLDRAERWGRQIGVRIVRIRTNVARERAHRFYLRAGYALTKTSHLFVKRLP